MTVHATQLTTRETQIYNLLEKGYSTDEIVEELKTSKVTVVNQIYTLMRKLGYSGLQEFYQKALKRIDNKKHI